MSARDDVGDHIFYMKLRTELVSYFELLNEIFSYLQVAQEFINNERGV